MTAADLLADDDFAGLLLQHWHVAGDERQRAGNPHFAPRHVGEDLLQAVLDRESETFEARPLKWMRLPCEVCGDAGSVRSHQNGRDITHPCPRGCWPLPRNPFSGMSPRHAYEQARNQTVTVQFDLSAAGIEGAIRDKLIAMGWTPPGQAIESFQQRFVDAVKDRNELHGQLAEAAPKAKLWDTLNAALMSRSGITLDNERDCYEAARQWADAHDDASSYKAAAQRAREQLDALAALKVELLTIPLSPHDPRPKLDG